MAAIDNDYIEKLCQRLGNKLDNLKAIVLSAEQTAQGGDLAGAQAILAESSAERKFAAIEKRRIQIIRLIAEFLGDE